MKLYGYWRSSATWRVRIGLHLLDLPYETVAVHLLADGGQQRSAEHRGRNPMAQVPALELDDGTILTQSLPILEYLHETVGTPPLLPASAVDRARCRQLAEVVNSGIQPLQNLSVLERVGALGADRNAWARDFIAAGLRAFAGLRPDPRAPFSLGAQPTIADLCLVPQLYNARRFDVSLEGLAALEAIEARCAALPAFAAAHPDRQPDATGA